MELNGTAFFMSYFLIGGWQVFSAIVHLFYKAPYKTTMRQVYLVLLAIIVALTFISSFVNDVILMLGEILLFLSPVMAVYYLVTCFVETKWLIDQGNAVAEQAGQ
jgi:Ca2+/Na+ antiporter